MVEGHDCNRRQRVRHRPVSVLVHHLSPKLLASISRTYYPVSVGKARIGACISASRRTQKADKQFTSHTNGTSFSVKATRGVGHDLTSTIFVGSHSSPRRPKMIERGGTWWILIAVHKTGVSRKSESNWLTHHQTSIQRI